MACVYVICLMLESVYAQEPEQRWQSAWRTERNVYSWPQQEKLLPGQFVTTRTPAEPTTPHWLLRGHAYACSTAHPESQDATRNMHRQSRREPLIGLHSTSIPCSLQRMPPPNAHSRRFIVLTITALQVNGAQNSTAKEMSFASLPYWCHAFEQPRFLPPAHQNLPVTR